MKKIISLVLALLMLLPALPMTALADVITSTDGDWIYNVIYEEKSKQYGEITAYKGSTDIDTLTVPNEIDGVQIVGINGQLITSGSYPESIIVSEGIEYITGYVFKEATISVSLPQSLEFIGEHSFEQAKIKEINLPYGLVAIQKYAFKKAEFEQNKLILPDSLEYLCQSSFENATLNSIHIGKNVHSTDSVYYSYPAGVSEEGINQTQYSPFHKAYIKTITVSPENTDFVVQDNALYFDNMAILLYVCNDVWQEYGNFTIPDCVQYVDTELFSQASIDTLVIGKNVRILPSQMFEGSYIKKLLFAEDCKIKYIDYNTFRNAKVEYMAPLPASIQEIDQLAFSKATIPNITFEENSMLRTIDDHAFSNSNIKSVDFSNCKYLEYLPEGVFKNSKVESVNIQNTCIRSISNDVFTGCSSLKSIVLSDITESLSTDVFKDSPIESIDVSGVSYYGDTGNEYVNNQIAENGNIEVDSGNYNGFAYDEFRYTVSITGYSGDNAKDIVFPSEINGKQVTKIGYTGYSCGFHGFSGTVEIPSTVKVLGGVFGSDNDIDEIIFNEGLKHIQCSFDYLEIEELRFPNSLQLMDINVLPNLKKLYIGNSFAYPERIITDYDFYKKYGDDGAVDISTIQEFIVSDGNPHYSSENGVLYNKDKTELIKYPCNNNRREFTIPDSVEEIGEYAFWLTEFLDTLTIGKNVGSIDPESFSYQESIENVCFKDNNKLTTLKNTFQFSKSIKHVEFGRNMAIKRMNGTFAYSTIESVTVPSSVRYLSGTFCQAKNLKTITIENGIEVLGFNAFASSGITTIKMPKSLKSIKYGAFQGCTELVYVDLTNVRTLERLVFKDCTSLTSIDLTGVRYDNSEKNNSFKGCTNLTKLYFSRDDGIEQFIGEDDVADNETVETVVIGGDINEIKSRAFANCKNLSVAMIGDGVTTIDDTAFEGCDKLTIVCTEESYAAKYAAKNSIRYTTLTVDSIPDQQYTGKAIIPAVIVRTGSVVLKNGSDYSAQYSDNIKVGSAKVTVVGKGDYSIYGALARFNIVHTVHKYTTKVVKPTYAAKGYTLYTCSLCGKSYKSNYKAKLTVPKTSISKLTKKKKAFTVKWKKVSVATGYQIQYSTNKNFKSKKTVTVKGAKNVTKTMTKLKGKKKYYVRVRAYKSFKGKNYYSAWSKAKTVTTKLK